tara:strand:- start:2334 stop:2507 length:174 start_codon:yes stop_codon:yes gene_type:complete
MFHLDQAKINDIKTKIINAEKFDFNEEEKDLIYKMTGFDLLNNSELKAVILLMLGKE